MTVKQILSAKGSNVSTIEPTATLESGIAVLAERRIVRIGSVGERPQSQLADVSPLAPSQSSHGHAPRV